MRCTNCEQEISEDNARWYNDNPYCENCFFDSYTYCARCDEPIDREYCRYDSHDEAVCSDCYEDDYDEDAPDNPEIYDSQRNEIIALANDWLLGYKPKRLIKISQNDYMLEEIQKQLGMVDKGLYLYGLQDRTEYQIKASENIIDKVKDFTDNNNWDVTVIPDTGINRLGISWILRDTRLPEIIDLLKELTLVNEETLA